MKHFSSGIVRTPRLSGFVILDLTSKVCPINLLAGSNPPASHISLYFLCRWKTTGVFKILCVWFSVDCIFPACHSLVSSPASGVCAGWGDEGGWGDRRSSVLLGVCVCVFMIPFLGNGWLQNIEVCLLVGKWHNQQLTERLAKTNRIELFPLLAVPA